MNPALTFIILAVLIYLPSTAHAGMKSLCGADDRLPYHDQRIGRLVKSLTDKRACTATLISQRCAISAGHCAEYYGFLEFEVPESNSDGSFNHPLATAIYPVDNLVDYDDQGTGNDWLVIRLNPNPITGLYPGSERGFYPIDWAAENSNQEVRLAGFGKDDQLERSYSLQVSYGKLLRSENDLILRHDADSTAGNSGTAIIDNKTEKIIGIHTNGGCQKNSNAGTWINKVSRLQKAIQECQDLDQKD